MFLLTAVLSATAFAASKTVATIGSTKYTSLDAAIKAVKSGETIVLKSDITTSDSITISRSGKTFTLNLNKHTITFKGSASLIVKKGTVTIRNGKIMHNKVAGTILKVSKAAMVTVKSGTYTGFISNAGTMNITKGTFSNSKSKAQADYEKNDYESVLMETRVFTNSGTLNISNGTFKCYYCGMFSNTGILNISGGVFDFKSCASPYLIHSIYNNTKNAKLTITGGTFDAGGLLDNTDGATALIKGGTFSIYSLYNEVEGSMTISDGDFKLIYAISSPGIHNYGSLTIKGGTFSSFDIEGSSEVDSDYWGVENRGGTLKVKGGTFKTLIYTESGAYNDVASIGKTTISGGTFYGKVSAYSDKYSAAVTIKGGTFKRKTTTLYAAAKGKITVSGGTFAVKKSAASSVSGSGKVTITGGTFAS
ncbi:MAG: hypothetical protein LUI07_05050 [Lachnospiraceae bacterium]|nr:hypothetical protein [Lachnospiraceae bacterium]